MTRSTLRGQALAICLAAVAGFVDAVGFLHVGGLFVSFMSGNSTRLAVGIAAGASETGLAAGLVASFVCGVVAGSLLGRYAEGRRRRVVLLLVGGLLVVASALGRAPIQWFAAATMAAAMGAANAVFERQDDIPFGVTYMTGALAKVGQRLALAMRGGPPFGCLPYLCLWIGLVAGAVLGAAAYGRLGPDCLWLAATAVLTLAAAPASRPQT